MLLEAARSQLLVIDVQEKLAPAMLDGEAAIRNMERLIAGAALLGVPAAAAEHYPRGLGASIARIDAALGADIPRFPKMTFSAARDAAIEAHVKALAAQGRRQLVLCGYECHVCVLQTALDFAARDLDVILVADATSSRAAHSIDIALRRMQAAGVTIVTTEMALFEWLERAGAAASRDIVRLVK